ncbi:hypothetical protein EMCRGX_G023715 [Ephydatia muelleri]
MSFLKLGASADVQIELSDVDKRKKVLVTKDIGIKDLFPAGLGEEPDSVGDGVKDDRLPLYFDGENVSGKVHVALKSKKLEHHGIRIEFVGQIEVYPDHSASRDFISLVRQLQPPGDLTKSTTFDFDFFQVEKPYESYSGKNVRLRYFLRVVILRRLADISVEREIAVRTLSHFPDASSSLRMEVGIEDCLHIEFEYNKPKYHLKDIVVGKVYFLLVRVKIRFMELSLIKKETIIGVPSIPPENQTIAKYEIMDGAPVKGETVPIRLFLGGYNLTPTLKDVDKKFSVQYYLNLVLVDEEDRRYFKQQEIFLWRRADPKVARQIISK